jgi:hypothetical protein
MAMHFDVLQRLCFSYKLLLKWIITIILLENIRIDYFGIEDFCLAWMFFHRSKKDVYLDDMIVPLR